MSGTMRNTVVNSIIQSFEKRCVELLIESFLFASTNLAISIDWEEENISAVLFNYIDNRSSARKWKIFICAEYRIYKEEILQNLKSAKKAPRIDFKLGGWDKKSNKLSYHVEAKNLIEIDTKKKGRTTKVNANSWHERYIDTGIDNYTSGTYPTKGCLIGYVLQGNTFSIIEKINTVLASRQRSSEILKRGSLDFCDFDSYFESEHSGARTLKHLLFNFALIR